MPEPEDAPCHTPEYYLEVKKDLAFHIEKAQDKIRPYDVICTKEEYIDKIACIWSENALSKQFSKNLHYFLMSNDPMYQHVAQLKKYEMLKALSKE